MTSSLELSYLPQDLRQKLGFFVTRGKNGIVFLTFSGFTNQARAFVVIFDAQKC